MNKKELTTEVAEKMCITKVLAGQIINSVFETLKESLKNEEPVIIKGFGSFSVRNRAERKGMNPSTHKPLTIPACKTVKFIQSKNLNIK